MKIFRVLVVGISDIFGGVEKAVLGIVNKSENIIFEFLCFGNETQKRREMLYGKAVYYIPSRKDNLCKSNKVQKEFWKNNGNKYDVIWINTGSASNITTHKFAKRYSTATVITHSHSSRIEHPNPIFRCLHYIRHYLNKPFLRRYTDVFLACSDKAAVHLFGKGQQFTLFNNAIDIINYSYDINNRKKIREKYNIGDRQIVLLMMGRLEKVKNPDYGIYILKKVNDEGKDAKLIFVGDGGLREHLERLADSLMIRQSVVFTGFQNDVIPFYSAADCLLLPSFFEGFPVVLIEAQANSLPCLVSNTVTNAAMVTPLVKYHGISDDDYHEWVNDLSAIVCRGESVVNFNNELKKYDLNYTSTKFRNILERCSDGKEPHQSQSKKAKN